MLHRTLSIPLLAALGATLAACLLEAAATAAPLAYPRLGLYGSQRATGYPLWDASGVLDGQVLDEIARYHEVAVEAYPITPNRPDALAALRQRRPDIVLLAIVAGENTWLVNDPDTTTIRMRERRLIDDLDGWLYNTDGGLHGLYNANLAKQTGGRFVVAEGLADLFYDAILRTGMWDGIFIDVYCDDIAWTEPEFGTIDVQRAGYGSMQAFRDAFKAGTDTLASRLRRLCGPDYLLVGNCGQGTKYQSFNGWMREGFPLQNGGTWYENMYREPGGYFTDERLFRAPRSNYIFSPVLNAGDPYSAENARRVRFGLGSAALGDGFGVFGPGDRDVRTAPYHEWWYDEYAVDLTTGRASPLLQHTGWLGEALGPATQMIWAGSGPDAVVNPDFETDVSTGWLFVHGVPSSLTRDASTAAEGSASAHVTVPSAAAVSWGIALQSTGTLSLVAGAQYSATFWAKAAVPRSIWVVAGRGIQAGSFASRSVQLTTDWRRYQVTLLPQQSGSSDLRFYLAGEAGDVWLDDVHFQSGVTMVHRRDFQNGVVLVNPSSSTQRVPLERAYTKIRGTVAPLVNDGLQVSQVDIPPSDALFLIGEDRIPPSAVQDVHPVK